MDIWTAIKDVGFPIAVAAFVLVRLNGKVGTLTDAMTSLTVAIHSYIESSEADRRETKLTDDMRTERAMTKVIEAIRAEHGDNH